MKTITSMLPGVPDRIVEPGREQPLARMATEMFGGVRGCFAAGSARRLPGGPLAVLFVGAAFLFFGFLAKSPCGGGMPDGHGGFGLDWSGSRQYIAACYNDIMPLYGIEGFKAGHFPYAYSWESDGHLRYNEYPVLTGLFMWVCAQLSRALYPLVAAIPGNTLPEVTIYFTITALFMAVMWLLTIRIVGYLAGNRFFDSLLVAASPLVAIHAFSNYDIIPCLFAVLAFAAVGRNKPLLAGVFLGLGTAFKLWPLFLLGAYLVVALRGKKLAPFFAMAGSTIVTFVVVNAPIFFLYPAGWREFMRLNTERGWEWTTVWAFLSRTVGWKGFDAPGSTPPSILNMVTLVSFLALCGAILVLGLRCRNTPRIAQLAFLIVASFLLVNKVYSPQYSLWLVPLAALALPQWRLVLSWALADAFLWPVLMWHMLGTDKKGLPHEFLDIMIVVRDGFIIAIAVLIIRAMMGRRADRVYEAHGGHDPLAGPFAIADSYQPLPRAVEGVEPADEGCTVGASAAEEARDDR